MAGGTTVSFGGGGTGATGMVGGNSLDPLYYGQNQAKVYSDAQSDLPSALAAYQEPDGSLSGDLDPELVQKAMRYIMNMPLESQYYETALDNSTAGGGSKSVKPMNYTSREQMDFVDQHETDKQAYETLVKDSKKRSSSSSTTSQGTSVLSGDSSLTSLYQTLLGGAS